MSPRVLLPDWFQSYVIDHLNHYWAPGVPCNIRCIISLVCSLLDTLPCEEAVRLTDSIFLSEPEQIPKMTHPPGCICHRYRSARRDEIACLWPGSLVAQAMDNSKK